MKKLLAAIIAISILVTSAVFVSADTVPFSVDITGPTVVPGGETATYTVSVNNIKVEGGVTGGTIKITYDTSVFELVESKISASLENWTMDFSNKGSGVLMLYPVSNETSGTSYPVTEDGKIEYKIAFKVNASTTKTSTKINVDSATFTDTSYGSVDVPYSNSFEIKIKKSLAAPTNLSWDGTTAKWDAVDNADLYYVQLYKSESEVGDAVEATNTSVDLASYMKEGGQYTFTVRADSDKEEYGYSPESAKCSSTYTKVGTLTAPKITIEADSENGGLKYQITDKNTAGSVSEYEITIKEGTAIVDKFNVNTKAGNIPLSDKIVAGKSYKASVIAKSADSAVNSDSEASSLSSGAKAADKPVSVSFKTMPSLAYKDGDKLALSKIIVDVTYQSGKVVSVKYSDFSSYGLTCNFANGTKMQIADTGKAFTVSLGSLSTSTPAITVTSGVCEHTSTKTVKIEPTCGKDGYESIVCNECGATLSSVTIPATGEHVFGEWEVVVNPTSTLKGMKQRTCSVCGHIESEEIPAVTAGDDTTNDPHTTSDVQTTKAPDTTKPDEEFNDPHEMDDISKIFLIITIVILLLIIFFLFAGVYLENKRAKQRRKRKASIRKK
ncbi:MAG: hypothetical protein KBT31_00345 [Firmicutes bacterium]|nr:hypothetical protein [Candidatus Colimorpha enterica]